MAPTNPVYPVEVQKADSVIEALAATIDDKTGVKYIAPGVDQDSTPSLQVQDDGRWDRMLTFLALLNEGRVVETGSLEIGVFPISYVLGGVQTDFDGAIDQAVPDNALKAVYLDSGNLLQIQDAFPPDSTTHLPLAAVQTVNGTMTITDYRNYTMWGVPQLSGSYAQDDLNNLVATTKINQSLLPDTPQDGLIDLGAAATRFRLIYLKNGVVFKSGTFGVSLIFDDPAAARNVTLPDFGGDDTLVALAAAQTLLNKILTAAKLATQLTLQQTTGDYTVTWDDPAAARALTVKDPGQDADFVTTRGTQILYDKTLITPLVSDLSNMPHDHSSTVLGGNIDQTAFGGLKLFSTFLTHVEAGTLSVSVLKWELVAPIDLTIVNATGRVVTAPADATLIVDLRVNGSSIFLNQSEMISIVSAANSDTSATKNHAVTAGDVITLEIEQVGSTVAGADLTVVLWCKGEAGA